MADKIAQFEQEINQLTVDYREMFLELSEVALNWKPNADTWSIGQVIDHVIKTNETYFPIFDGLQKGDCQANWLRHLGFLVRFFGNFILKKVEPTRQQKIKTFPIWEPASSNIPDDIVQRFMEHQNKLSIKINENKAFILRGTVIHSPASKMIVYTLEQAVEIIIAHEKRHLNQAADILTLLHNQNV